MLFSLSCYHKLVEVPSWEASIWSGLMNLFVGIVTRVNTDFTGHKLGQFARKFITDG